MSGRPIPKLALLGVITWTYLWFFPYFEGLNNPNENVRLYLTRAMVDHGSVAIGQRSRGSRGKLVDGGNVIDEWGYVNDKALICQQAGETPPCEGTLYAAKAPGTSWLGLPEYAALSLFNGVFFDKPPSKIQTVWWLRLIANSIPSLILLWMLAGFLLSREDIAPEMARLLLLGLAIGSPAFAYSRMFVGHYLAGIPLAAAFLLLLSVPRPGPRRLVLCGLLCASSVAIEYPAALPGAIVGLYALRRCEGWRDRALLLAGVLPVVLALGAYHWAAFGSPLTLPYDHLENRGFVRDMATGWHGIQWPSPRQLFASLFHPEFGLLFYSPWAICALPGAWAWSRRRDDRALACVCGAVCGVVLLFLASMPKLRVMLGWTVGPRYGLAMLPFVALLSARGMTEIARAWPRAGRAFVWGLVLTSLLTSGLPGLLYPHYPMELRNPTFELALPLLLEGWIPHQASDLLGIPALLGLLLGIGPLLFLLSRLVMKDDPQIAHPLFRLGSAFCLAAVLVSALAMTAGPTTPHAQKKVAWVKARWEPKRVPFAPCAQAARAARLGQGHEALGVWRTQSCGLVGLPPAKPAR